MATINLIRADAYALRRPLWNHEFVDRANLPFDFAGSTVLTTYKPAIVPVEEDPDDALAIVRHGIEFNMDGIPTTENGLFYVAPGIIEERFPSELTRGLPAGVNLMFDVRLIDANGEPFTFVMIDQIVARDTVTNRLELAS